MGGEASKEEGDITQEEEDYTLSVISRHELSGTSELFPGTTLKRNGEVSLFAALIDAFSQIDVLCSSLGRACGVVKREIDRFLCETQSAKR
jgi:hypothetical protein